MFSISTPQGTGRRDPRSAAMLAVGAAALAVAVAFGMRGSASAAEATGDDSPIEALPGYHVSIFAHGTRAYFNPDAIVVDHGHVYVAYQNDTAKDGSDHKSSTIVEYTMDGAVVRSFSIVGHCDGMRLDPRTHLLWALVNNDANPAMYTINPRTGDIDAYTFSSAPHGGGYDDVAFHDGMAFVSASNPTLNAAGVNAFPAVDKVTLQGSTTVLTPVLLGNAPAHDTTTDTTVALNEVDPDSMSVSPAGDVVLVDQAGSDVVFLHHAGTSQQTVTRLAVGTQLDDTVWATAQEGRLWVVDSAANAVYTITTNFKSGSVYTEAPSDSGVASFVGTLNLKTGTVVPVAIGFKSPTGLLFTAGEDER